MRNQVSDTMKNLYKKLCVMALGVMLIGAASAAETIIYLHNDVVGSPLVATDQSGNVVWKESYHPYGEQLQKQAASANNHLWYADKSFEQSSGLSYSGARYYDPMLGRFMGMDAVGFQEGNIHSFNRYTYGNNNPYKYIDPDGRLPVLIPIAVVLVAEGLNLLSDTHDMNVNRCSDCVRSSGAGLGIIGAGLSAEANVAQKSLSAIRQSYVEGVDGLVGLGQSMRAAGVSAEDALRILSPLRNELKMELRREGSWIAARAAELRNLIKYGDKAGPSAEALIKQYGSSEKALEALGRTNKTIDRVLGANE